MTVPHPDGREPGDRDPGGPGGAGAAEPSRVPRQREAPGTVPLPAPELPELPGLPEPAEPAGLPPAPRERSHQDVMSLLGAWALAACSPEEAESVEAHLNDCAACADEALRLCNAATLLEPQRSLDLDPHLRPRVLEGCLARRPAALPVPSWAEPYDAEAARLDALLNDINAEEWRAPVTLRWYAGGDWERRSTTVGGVLDHLLAVDGLLARTVGLRDPLDGQPAGDGGPMERTLARWAGEDEKGAWNAWAPWREQSRALVRAAARTGGRVGERTIPHHRYGDPGLFLGGDGRGELALSDAYLGRAFACWVHADDIAQAVDYPYDPPLAAHLRLLVDLTARRLPGSIAGRRRAGLANLAGRLTPAGKPGRTLHLEVEGAGGGDFYISLDSATATVSRAAARRAVAHVALDDVLFCQLASGRITPEEAAEGAGVEGDTDAVHDVLFAAADLSRL
ncbi:zf-HC2 domain-containing protein [Streptomyces sp. 6N223]|uniref:zf-HC2 domain-containing protein n=1 Tax=Streptomyces sp. 6N223 TaxID=3457412 RepID=UPI003FD36CCE